MKCVLLAGLVAVGLLAQADEFMLKTECDGTVVDWTASASYVGDPELPQDRSTMIIRVPAITVKVTDATVAQIKDVEQILPESDKTVIELDLAEDVALNCCVTPVVKGYVGRNDGNKATLLKKGSGVLSLASCGKRPDVGTSTTLCNDYAVHINVQEGIVCMPPANGAFVRQQIQRVTLGEHGKLVCGQGLNTLYFYGMFGAGVLTNESKSVVTIYARGNGAVFAGQIGGLFNIDFGGKWTLTGTNSTYSGLSRLCASDAVLGVASFGKRSGPASLGIGTPANTYDFAFNDDGGTLRYDGPGEVSDRGFLSYNESTTDAAIPRFDGGAYGGLVLTGPWSQSGTDRIHQNQAFVLCGTNAAPCVIRGNVQMSSKRTTGRYAHYIFAKSGSGSWMFDGRQDSIQTPFFIYGGTLGFTSLCEKDLPCAAGKSTHLIEFSHKNDEDCAEVDFAFQLGKEGSGDVGTFALMASNITTCTTRPFALAGRGRILNDMPTPLRLSDFRVLGTGARELTLGGAGMSENEIAGIVDTSASPVSIVKDGPGNWALNGSNTVHGSITVKGGRLTVKNRTETKYSWFDFVIRGQTYEDNDYCYHCGRIGIYGADGYPVFTDPKYVSRGNRPGTVPAAGVVPSILPGEMTLPRPWLMHAGADTANRIFSTKSNDRWEAAYRNVADNDCEKTSPSRPETFTHVLFRLTNSAPEVASYDLVQWYGEATTGNDRKRQVCAWSLLGSVDGIHWTTLSEETKYEFPPEGKTWASRGTVYVNEASDLPHENGYPVVGHASEPIPFTVMDDVESVSVVSGGVFACEGPAAAIRKLIVDATSGGMISNCTIAADATLDVVRLDPKARTATLPVEFADVSGLEDTSGWSMSVNGGSADRYILSYRNGRLCLCKKGLVLIVR